jgi:hypothetical protein
MTKRALPAAMRAVISLFAIVFGLALGMPPAIAAPSAATSCWPDEAAATDGHLALDRSLVRPGEQVLGVLSGFEQWPEGLFGGSGETFQSCGTWGTEETEVIRHDTAGFFLLSVPAHTKLGTYQVVVRFYPGSAYEDDGTKPVRLTTSVTVTDEPMYAAGVSAACALRHAEAAKGRLTKPVPVLPGGELPVSLTGVKSTGFLNEYDDLYFIACLAGRATPVAYSGAPRLSFTMAVPSELRPGTHKLVVTGVSDQVVSWRRSIRVQRQQAATPTPTRTQQPPVAVTGSNPWLPAAAAAALAGTGGVLLLTARRRRPTR